MILPESKMRLILQKYQHIMCDFIANGRTVYNALHLWSPNRITMRMRTEEKLAMFCTLNTSIHVMMRVMPSQ